MESILEAYGDASSKSSGSANTVIVDDGYCSSGGEELKETHFTKHANFDKSTVKLKNSTLHDYYQIVGDESSEEDQDMRGAKFDKALLNFYVKNKVKQLKRKLTSSRCDKFKRTKPEISESATTFTRYSGTYFSSVVKLLTPYQRSVIEKYGAQCMLIFEKTDVPLRFVKWVAGKFDTRTCEIQVSKQIIPVTAETIHTILELPIGGLELAPDSQRGRNFILSHFNVTSIPQVSFFGNKLKSGQFLSDDDIFICFMVVVFQSFLCPNSSLQPSSEYLHIFSDPMNVMKYNLSKYVHDWLINSIKKFQKATKRAARRQITLGGNHYSLAVAYLDSVEFGLNSLPDIKPRVLVWKGSRIRKYAELDKCSGNSYGKRPLRRLSQMNNIQKPQDKFTNEPLRQSTVREENEELLTPQDDHTHEHVCQTSVLVENGQTPQGKHTCEHSHQTSVLEENGEAFVNKLKTLFSSWISDKQIQTIQSIVLMSNHGEPKEMQMRFENVTLDVLKTVFTGNQSVKSVHTDGVITGIVSNKNSEANCNTPVTEGQSNFNGSSSAHSFDLNLTFSRGKLASGKYQRLSKLLSSVDFDKHEDDEIGKCNIEDQNNQPHDRQNNNSQDGFKEPDQNELKKEEEVGNKLEELDFLKNKATIPTTPVCPIDIIESHQMNSVSPMKKAKPKCKDFSNNNSSLNATSNRGEPAGNKLNQGDKTPQTNGLSPIVPIILSHLFNNNQEQKDACAESKELKDCILPSSTPRANLQSAFLQKSSYIDLSSPVCGTSQVFLIEDSPKQVQITGYRTFDQRCSTLSKQTDDAYNKLLLFTNATENTIAERTYIQISSQEKEFDRTLPTKDVRPSAKLFEESFISKEGEIASQSCSPGFTLPQRVVMPGRFNCDPYVTQATRYPVKPSERRYYSAICQIGAHSVWKKNEAVRYDRAYCSFDSLATLQPFGHVDNYVILVYCRKLFLDCHPSESKKHCFFSYIGETILKYNGRNGDVVQMAFEGANKALKMWKADQLSFPVCINEHWFVFVVCLKAKYFAFLDSLYSAQCDFHAQYDMTMIQNFVTLWNLCVTPLMSRAINFNEYQVIHPHVPRQGNTDDCGVYAAKAIAVWNPRVNLQNVISKDDIINLRIKLANEIYFSTHNSVDKTIVSEYFGDVGM